MARTKEKEKEILADIEKHLILPYSPQNLKLGGHDFTHCQRMCRIAEKIWPTLKTISGIKEAIESGDINLFLLQTAIWLHNLDRSSQFTQGAEAVVWDIHNNYGLSITETGLIADAVAKHSGREQPNDSALLRALRYCDMLDFGPIGILRIGAYRHTPYVASDLKNPDTVPGQSADKLASALSAVSRVIEWWTKPGYLPEEIKSLDWVRRKFEFMIEFRKKCLEDLEILGIS